MEHLGVRSGGKRERKTFLRERERERPERGKEREKDLREGKRVRKTFLRRERERPF